MVRTITLRYDDKDYNELKESKDEFEFVHSKIISWEKYFMMLKIK